MTIEAKVQVINNGNGNGQVASRFAAGGGLNVNAYRPYIGFNGKTYINQMVNNKLVAVPVNANATLLKDEWIEMDEAVLKIARERLTGATDLTSRGLVKNLTNPMGKTIFQYQDMDDPGEASIGMTPVEKGVNDTPDFLIKSIPIPIIFADFTIDNRLLTESRNQGESLDTLMVESCTRRILEKEDDMFFTDETYSYGGGTIYSYLNQPNINTVTLSENWDASGKTGEEIKDDVLAMKAALIAAKHFGPYILYIPTDYETVLDDDYRAADTKTIKERLLGISGISEIKVVDHLADDTVLMVQLSSDVVRLINGFGPRVIQWDTQGGMIHNFKVMSIRFPQIRADQAGNSGVCELS